MDGSALGETNSVVGARTYIAGAFQVDASAGAHKQQHDGPKSQGSGRALSRQVSSAVAVETVEATTANLPPRWTAKNSGPWVTDPLSSEAQHEARWQAADSMVTSP